MDAPKPVDLQELTERILAINRGELPEDAVTTEELRAALNAQRDRFAKGALPPTAASGARSPSSKNFIVVPPPSEGEGF